MPDLALLVISPPLSVARFETASETTIKTYPVLFDPREHAVTNITLSDAPATLHLTELYWTIHVHVNRDRVFTHSDGPFYDVSRVHLRDAERMVKTLRTINHRMAAVASRHGRPADIPEATARFLRAIGAHHLVLQTNWKATQYSHSTFDSWSAAGSRDALTQILRERTAEAEALRRSLYGAAA